MDLSIALVTLAGVLGLAIGSFANVAIHRLPRRQSVVSPASHCPECETPIKARHNVPVLSWLALRGRCAHCHSQISPRYPLVEAGTALAFAAVTALVLQGAPL
jgi:leader peptidase (prepilin peptidase)/N-methyltransferase